MHEHEYPTQFNSWKLFYKFIFKLFNLLTKYQVFNFIQVPYNIRKHSTTNEYFPVYIIITTIYSLQ
jgi:hypothetical protein